MPSPVRFAEVRKLLEEAGYELARISGSHHIFVKDGSDLVSIPVHKGLVKYGYVRRIQKIIDAEQAREEEPEEPCDGE
ncbi:type II toxin-antitoxin system HicA family toxin [Anatilimnocola sp. NA78]|uniref:type II toxin-antitoxin system HicA family toxin n=1 Tax=Anatilimnocola sp. NA78 TaxID=3415683 RepID=UPI003CE5803C